ncbi:hypothetical protein CTAYLR_003781 [Chrysophaeum taylorii]|uniref:Lipocalin/cytosolic fatty-acid binding domain-containing protein n=1 Tax=Chrysophaeum taylorii TaxID=2483200 RepID=A0AAD7XLL2_9STRA|nr:hypothetical protein CTAYLR_003781 [Chrysophaeum taylorii]
MGNTLPPLKTVPVEVPKMMGTWFVIGVLPTPFEHGAHNAREIYTLRDESSGIVDIDFTFNKGSLGGPLKSLPQTGYNWGSDKWQVSPLWPLKLPYLVIESSDRLDDEDAYFVVGYPSRKYCWVMARKPEMEDAKYEGISKRLVETHQYKTPLIKVRHKWTKTGDTYARAAA